MVIIMIITSNAYILILIVSQIIILFLSFYIMRFRPYGIFKEIFILFLLFFLMVSGNMIEIVSKTINVKVFWANVQYISYVFLPFIWFIIVNNLEINNNKWLNFNRILTLALFPTIAIVGVWSNNLHGFFRREVSLVQQNSFLLLNNDYGPWFWYLVIQSYFFIIVSVIILLKYFINKEKYNREQASIFLLSIGVIWIPNIINNIEGIYAAVKFDISPAFTAIAGILIFIGLDRYRVFNLTPITRKMVVEEMGMGIMVLDNNYRILDINPGANKMLNVSKKFKIGLILPEEIKFKLGINKINDFSLVDKNKLRFLADGEYRIFEINVSPFRTNIENLQRWIFILNNITDLEKAKEQVLIQQKELAVMEERERMSRDLHDNLGQVMSYANLQTQAVKLELGNGNIIKVNELLDELIKHLGDSHQDIRRYIYDTRKSNILQKNFMELIQEELIDFENKIGIKTELITTQEINNLLQKNEHRIHLIYILKEALNNIIKYSSATVVKVLFKKDASNLILIINDNGEGFEDIDINKKRGSGLAIMEERVNFMEGGLKIESNKGKGTILKIVIPQK